MHTIHRDSVQNPHAFLSSRLPRPGSGMGTLQQLLDKDTTLFDKMTAHQVYSFIQLVKASSLPLHDNVRHDDRLSSLFLPVVALSLAMRTWTTSAVLSYPRDRFPVPGNAYAPLCPRSSPLRPSLMIEYGPILPHGIRTMPPISYSMTRACTFLDPAPSHSHVHSFIHAYKCLLLNQLPPNTKFSKK